MDASVLEELVTSDFRVEVSLRSRQLIPPKFLCPSVKLHNITAQKTNFEASYCSPVENNIHF
jgi:hypothetical protein